MIASVHKAMQILRVLSDGAGRPMPLSALTQQTGLPKPTCAHLVRTLMQDGYVEQVSRSAGYVLGPETYCLTRFGRYDNEWVALCRPVLRWLHRQTGEAIVLAVIRSEKKFIIDLIDPTQHILPNSADIRPDDIYRTATGRAILANLRPDEVSAIYARFGAPGAQWDNMESLDELQAAAASLPRRGVIVTEQPRNGAIALGYGKAVHSATGCVGAVGVAAEVPPAERAQFAARDPAIRRALAQCVAEIERRMQFD